MNRRAFVSSLATTAGALLCTPAKAADANIKRVLVMFKCHLDVGFVDTQAAIIHKYFESYFPQAIETAANLREAGGDRYVWTTGSWLIYEYLEQANSENRKRMETALHHGDLAWHALPFTWQSELLDPTAITGAIGFSKSLDRRFGRNTTGAKMTDVPGHSRGLIAPLARSGVKLLDIGVNSASTPPDVPPAFVWKDLRGKSLVMLYHRTEYGGVVQIPDSGLAIAVEVRDDNSGPHTLDEIHKIYADLRAQFPNAEVKAANLTEIAEAVEPHRNKLPVVTEEIGDTWIYGIPSDPVKVARYRELLRLRREWIGQRKIEIADSTDLKFLSKFALAAEHTWGTDTKTWLDFDHYTPAALASKLGDPKYKTVTGSWVEKRADIDDAVAGLPAALRDQAEKRLATLKPMPPDTGAFKKFDPNAIFETAHFTVGLDHGTGAITHLTSKASRREWAAAKNPLALFSYQTFSKSDYDRFLAGYITLQTDWAPKDFGKPNIEKFGAASKIWKPEIVNCWFTEDEQAHSLVTQLAFGKQEAVTAWPETLYLVLRFPKSAPEIELDLSWFRKRANRLPEALWLTFKPIAPETKNWMLSKLEQQVSPFNVLSGGNQHMHALSNGLSYSDTRGKLAIESIDAPVAALGEMSPIYFSKAPPGLAKGVHFSLFNNGWGTNYVQWFGEDMRFRFILKAS